MNTTIRTILNFNTQWSFTKQATEIPSEISSQLPADWESVDLPHSWNALDGQDGGNDYHRGTCYYAKTFAKADLPAADHYYLEIRGANSSADAYVNGQHLAHHDGGYSTWRVDLTAALQPNTKMPSGSAAPPQDFLYKRTVSAC